MPDEKGTQGVRRPIGEQPDPALARKHRPRAIPVITIFVRHAAKCPHRRKGEFFKGCKCWKHLRWSYASKQYRRAAGSRTWEGAVRERQKEEAAYEAKGQPCEDQPTTLREIIEIFLRDKEGQNLNAGVLKKYRRELARFAEFSEKRGKAFLAHVALPDLTDYRATWEAEYPSSRTRQKVQERLRSFFRYSLNAGLIARNPAAALSPVKVDVAPTLPLDASQYEKLLKAVGETFGESVKAARVRALIHLMRYTGLAIGDAVTLERAAISFDAGKKITRIVTARAKTGVDVSIPIPADLASELAGVASGNPRYVFWQTGNGERESAVKQWHKDLKQVFEKAGMPDGHPHQLRDTAAVEWLNAGIPLEEVSRLLGHASIRTTERHYAPWVKSRQDRLDSLVMATWASGGRVTDANLCSA